MITEVLSCANCGYPLAGHFIGEKVTCPNCKSHMEAIANTAVESPIADVSVPTPLVTFVIGLVLGIVGGSAILASTEAGAQWLEKQVRERM